MGDGVLTQEGKGFRGVGRDAAGPDRLFHDRQGQVMRRLDPRKRPWVTPDGITSEKIMDQIKKCPSGALGYYLNKDLNKEAVAPKQNETALPTQDEAEVVIEATRNGPLLVHGTVSIKDQHGAIIKKKNAIALCRCGGSGNKPFCDGTHKKTNFEG